MEWFSHLLVGVFFRGLYLMSGGTVYEKGIDILFRMLKSAQRYLCVLFRDREQKKELFSWAANAASAHMCRSFCSAASVVWGDDI